MWYCETCDSEFFNPAFDYSCPECASRFIVEITDEDNNEGEEI